MDETQATVEGAPEGIRPVDLRPADGAAARGSGAADDGRVLRIGVAGLGRAFMVMLPTLVQDRRVRLVAAADPRIDARLRFEADFQGRAYATVEAMVADPDVDVVYVASPHALHVAHVCAAAARGRHVLVEKPMALDVAQCRAMIDATEAAGVHLLVGHSHSYDRPYLQARALIDTGRFGAVRMICALNFTDFLYRPRREEELDTGQGGGAVYNQAPHQVEVVRLLAGGRARSVRASTGVWDRARPTEGAYTAFVAFDDGVAASLTYNGHGRFDTDAWMDGIGEMGQPRDAARAGASEYGAARRRLAALATPAEEAALKAGRAYGGDPNAVAAASRVAPAAYNHFGTVIVSCEGGDLRPMPGGVLVYGDEAAWFEALPPPAVPRAEVIDELVGTILHRRAPLHSGAWGMATVEICNAILQSSREGTEISLVHQVGLRDVQGGSAVRDRTP